jgi:hypothetical protein
LLALHFLHNLIRIHQKRDSDLEKQVMIQQHVTERIKPAAAVRILAKVGIITTTNTVTRWCQRGVLKMARKIGGQWYLDPEEVRKMVE